MTDNDIIKAAECCLQTKTKDDCSKIGCPSCYENGGCHLYDTVDDDYYALFYWFTAELLKIANHQKAEIERLKTENKDISEQFRILDVECERLEKANEKQKAELEKLREHIELLDIEHEAIKNSAVKAFAEATIEEVRLILKDSYNGRTTRIYEIEEERVYVGLDAVVKYYEGKIHSSDRIYRFIENFVKEMGVGTDV